MATPLGSQKLLERLIAEKRINPVQQEAVVVHAQRNSVRIEDAIIETGVMDEQDLLRYVASIYKTRFVSTEKLSNANIERNTLALVPRKIAEKMQVFPVVYDVRSQTLSVVTPDVDSDIEKQLTVAAGVKTVKVFVGRPASVRAAIEKHYGGQQSAFSNVGGAGYASFAPGLDFGDYNALAESGMGAAFSPTLRNSDMAMPGSNDPFGGLASKAPPMPKAPAPPPQPQFPHLGALGTISALPPAETDKSITPEDYAESVNVLVALLENTRAELRGHSALVGRFARKLCERVGVPEREAHDVLIAAYLHDVGKASLYHLTALNVAEYEGHRVQAQKSFLVPVKLFESVKLSDSTTKGLAHLYERWDGQGFPDRLSGKDIPLAARVLAIVETYADITTNARNPFRKVLPAKDACEALAKHKGTIFDPNLVDLFRLVVLGDDLKSKLLADRRSALLIDADPEETTILELRLIEHGLDVVIARNANDARKAIDQAVPDVIISEVEIGVTDGFALLEELRGDTKTTAVPVIFVTKRGDRDSVRKGFELGAADYVVKPASADVVVAKMQKLLESKPRKAGARGVSGSLTEMALPDVIQVLAAGRKSGQLKITSSGKEGELHFLEGQIHNALFGSTKGAEAVYAMLQLSSGDFALDPNHRPSGRTIHESAEALLLEGMRRLDER